MPRAVSVFGGSRLSDSKDRGGFRKLLYARSYKKISACNKSLWICSLSESAGAVGIDLPPMIPYDVLTNSKTETLKRAKLPVSPFQNRVFENDTLCNYCQTHCWQCSQRVSMRCRIKCSACRNVCYPRTVRLLGASRLRHFNDASEFYIKEEGTNVLQAISSFEREEVQILTFLINVYKLKLIRIFQ